MSDLAQLREALEVLAAAEFDDELIEEAVVVLEREAHKHLALKEAGALIIVPDEDGEWPEWAIDPMHSPLTADALKTKGLRVALLDALRDAKPEATK